MIDLHEMFGHLSDLSYRDMLSSVAESRAVTGTLPSFPSEAVQAQFVGSAFKDALNEAFNFYSHVKRALELNGQPLTSDQKFLDFGCGWGRFIRFFGRDVRPENIFGVDVDPKILEICKITRVPGRLERIEPMGALPAPIGSIDLAIAYSVFTHLPEVVHTHWMKELARVIAPGGVLAMTLEPRRFLDFVEQAAVSGTSEWHRGMARFASDVSEFKKRFDNGEFVYLATGGGDYRPEETYGDAVVPLSYIETRWTSDFEILEYLDDDKLFWQAVLILRRK